MSKKQCPICIAPSDKDPVRAEIEDVYCGKCGSYRITATADIKLRGDFSPYERAILSHALRQRSDPRTVITTYVVDQFLATTKLPTPPTQAENLILWVGTNCSDPGHLMPIDENSLTAVIGAISPEGVDYVARDLTNQGLLERDRTSETQRVRLTLAGWRHHDELKRGRVDSRTAFMAMKFGDDDLDAMYKNVFVPAVKQTGFNLTRLDTTAKAGLIDDHLRVAIITSRLILADLTHGNFGAYWEAGYAEGKDKPVIYTCRKDVFEEKSTHFDTNHHTHVMWDPTDPEGTEQRLKDTIRATLPAEAAMTDDEEAPT